MFRSLRLSLVVFVAAEVLSLVWLTSFLGFWGSIAFFILSGVIGSRLIRKSGASLTRLFQAGPGQAQDASHQAAGSLLMALAGVLVMLPGLVSDAVALLLLLPATRQKVAKFLNFDVMVPPMAGAGNDRQPSDTTIIEGEAIEIIEPDRRLR